MLANRIFVLTPLTVILCISWLYYKSDMIFKDGGYFKYIESGANESPPPHTKTKKQTYLGAEFSAVQDGGLGNQIFELVAVLGMANQTNRIPYIKLDQKQVWKKISANIFPRYPKLIQQFFAINEMKEESYYQFNYDKFAIDKDVDMLKNVTADAIVLFGDVFKSFKYFDHLHESIRSWMTPNEAVENSAKVLLPKELTTHFIVCVHVPKELQSPSDEILILHTTNYLLHKYKELNGSKVLGVIIGNEPQWVHRTFEMRPDIQVLDKAHTEVLWSFSQQFCNVVLTTSSSSSVGWWMAYLAKEDAPVYFADITPVPEKEGKEPKHRKRFVPSSTELDQEDYYPPAWTFLRSGGGRIMEVIRKDQNETVVFRNSISL